MSPAAETLSVILPLHNAEAALAPVVQGWLDTLSTLKIDAEIFLVDDGSTDGTAARAEEFAARHGVVRLLKHTTRQGTGACLRTALAASRGELILFTAADYPYTPGDVAVFLERIRAKDERLGTTPSLVGGCRTGRPVPLLWKSIGLVYRTFLRAALGIPSEPLKGWLGLGEHLRAWRAWVIYGVPFTDPNCAFMLCRRGVFDRFPIQCDGDFARVEIPAKLTFLTSILDEVPLTPKPDAVPRADWGDARTLFRHAIFTPPPGSTGVVAPLAEIPAPA